MGFSSKFQTYKLTKERKLKEFLPPFRRVPINGAASWIGWRDRFIWPVQKMNPTLCCIALESPDIGVSIRARSIAASSQLPHKESDGNSGRHSTAFAGMLYKWTSYRNGWRSRWFLLWRDLLTYSKIQPSDYLNQIPPNCDVRLIGDISVHKLSKLDSGSCSRKRQKTVRVVQLKVC